MNLKEATCEITGQLKFVLGSLTADKYTQRIELLSNSSLGQHFRHVIECFNCFLEGYNSGVINYDNRKRDLDIEVNMEVAFNFLRIIETELTYLDLNKRLQMEASFSLHEQKPAMIHTSSGRELIYNIEHAIHHMAIIKIGLRNICPDLVLPENFGVAHSTIKHQNKACVQ